jgi:imidazolonepropionase-like amidohydrolase
MNWEAAKMLRTGMSEETRSRWSPSTPRACSASTDRVGSLEAGKDADFVIWSGNPLSTLHARRADLDRRPPLLRPRGGPQLREQVERERSQLIQFILAALSMENRME